MRLLPIRWWHHFRMGAPHRMRGHATESAGNDGQVCHSGSWVTMLENLTQIFPHELEIDGPYHDTIAAYAPHQNGMKERRGQTWKRAFENALESVSAAARQKFDEVIDQVTCAVNTLPRVGGHSPYQHAFGKQNRLPGNLELDVGNDVESSCPWKKESTRCT